METLTLTAGRAPDNPTSSRRGHTFGICFSILYALYVWTSDLFFGGSESPRRKLTQHDDDIRTQRKGHTEVTFAYRSFLPTVQHPCSKRDDGVIIDALDSQCLVNLHDLRKISVYKWSTFLFSLTFIITIWGWQENWQSLPHLSQKPSAVDDTHLATMPGILQLLTLASPVLGATIGCNKASSRDSSSVSVSVPAACPTDASPIVDPSFPGYAIEVASVVEYATGQPSSLLCCFQCIVQRLD